MIRMDDVDVHAICIDQQLQEAEHIVDLIESTSDSGESEDQRPSPEVENRSDRHASGTGSMGREDSGSGAAEKASTVDTGGVGVELNLSSQRLPCAQGVATATRKSTRRMMRAGMMIARGRE